MSAIETAVIGGSGFYQLNAFENSQSQWVSTPFGDVELEVGIVRQAPAASDKHPYAMEGSHSKKAAFLPRHAKGHKVPPHKVNYRANLWALKTLGVKRIFAINAVGGIGQQCGPGVLVVPDQIIDYTYGREQTFADTLESVESHIDFTWPYDELLRQELLNAAKAQGEQILANGCYGCTQGPRLETAAEVQRLARDGNTLVGMTAMPEAALARELGIQYASLCIVANWAAGLTEVPIAISDMMVVLDSATAKAQRIIQQALIPHP